MIKSLIYIVLLVFSIQVSYGQTENQTTRQELEGNGFVISTAIKGYPEKELPDTITKAFVATKYGTPYEIQLLFSGDGTVFRKISYLMIDSEEFYGCLSPYVDYHYEKEVLELVCREMKGIYLVTELGIKHNELTFLDNTMKDVNEDIYPIIEKAYKEDDPIAYYNAQFEIEYNNSFEENLVEGLVWAHTKALQAYKKKDYKTASFIMEGLNPLEFDWILDVEEEYLSRAELIGIWSDASLFFVKAGNNEACIALAKLFLEKNHEATNMYLQYGDALFNTGQKEAASHIYQTYANQMKAKGRNAKIPSRVKERIE